MTNVLSKAAFLRFGAALAVCMTTACVEERIVKNRPMLASLPNAVVQRPVTAPEGAVPLDTLADDEIVVENQDGSVTLLAKTGRQLMIHIVTTLDNGQRDLFIDQVLSTTTRNEFLQRGLDPGLAFDECKRRRDSIDTLFARMPGAEASPGVRVKQVEKKTMRIQLTGLAGKDLYWIGFDMTMERGNWKLRWFVPGTG